TQQPLARGEIVREEPEVVDRITLPGAERSIGCRLRSVRTVRAVTPVGTFGGGPRVRGRGRSAGEGRGRRARSFIPALRLYLFVGGEDIAFPPPLARQPGAPPAPRVATAGYGGEVVHRGEDPLRRHTLQQPQREGGAAAATAGARQADQVRRRSVRVGRAILRRDGSAVLGAPGSAALAHLGPLRFEHRTEVHGVLPVRYLRDRYSRLACRSWAG